MGEAWEWETGDLCIVQSADCYTDFGTIPLLNYCANRFLPRDAMHSADYASHDVRLSVCPSVRLSVTRRYFIEMAKRILKLFFAFG